MNYNMWIDLAFLGGGFLALVIAITILDRRGRKSPRVHMIDQAKRWGK